MAIELTLALVMFIIGIVLGAIGLFKGWKTKSVKTWMTIVTLVLLGLPVLAWANILPLAAITRPLAVPTAIPEVPTVPAPEVPEELCPVEDTTVTLSAIDKYTAVATGGTHRYRINGAPAKTVSDAGTFAASPGDTLEILWYNESNNVYYGAVDTVVIPCAGTKTYSAELAKNGTLTISVWNEEGVLIDSAGNNETLAAGDVVSLDMELKGQYQRDIPYGMVAVIEYNKTAIDDVVIAGEAGNELESDAVPQAFSITYGSAAATKAYLFPAVISNAKWKGTITIDADDSVNPGESNGGDIKITLYPRDYYINEDNGGAFEGPAAEDEDNALTRDGYFTYTLYVD